MYSTKSKARIFVFFFCLSDISLTFHLVFWKTQGWFFYWNVCVYESCSKSELLSIWLVPNLSSPGLYFPSAGKNPLHEQCMLDRGKQRCGPAFPVSLLQTRFKLNYLKGETFKFLSYLGQSSVTSIVLLDAAGSALERDLSEPLDDVRRIHNLFFYHRILFYLVSKYLICYCPWWIACLLIFYGSLDSVRGYQRAVHSPSVTHPSIVPAQQVFWGIVGSPTTLGSTYQPFFKRYWDHIPTYCC